VQLFPQGLGNHNPARFIYGEKDVHLGTLLWVNPLVNTILPHNVDVRLAKIAYRHEWGRVGIADSLTCSPSGPPRGGRFAHPLGDAPLPGLT
jgi:hypothetical protein